VPGVARCTARGQRGAWLAPTPLTPGSGRSIVVLMPTYEYHCNACHREFEYQQRMSDADLVRCEACGEDKLERLISWTSVRSNPGVRKVHYTADKMEGTPRYDRSLPQRFTGTSPTEPSGDASVGAAATSDAVPLQGEQTKNSLPCGEWPLARGVQLNVTHGQ
jgi:putative FmdB family regulatory protein